MSNDYGWIGVDLDGTLAEYHPGDGIESIGAPIPRMIERVRDWLSKGIEVRIITARVGQCGRSNDDGQVDDKAFADYQRLMITNWCHANIGQELEVTCSKDFQMIQLWDDRCIQVMPNTGISFIESIASKVMAILNP